MSIPRAARCWVTESVCLTAPLEMAATSHLMLLRFSSVQGLEQVKVWVSQRCVLLIRSTIPFLSRRWCMLVDQPPVLLKGSVVIDGWGDVVVPIVPGEQAHDWC